MRDLLADLIIPVKCEIVWNFETEQLEEHTRKFVLNHTSIEEDFYKEKYRIEWYMLPDEAKRYGICDHIVGEDCTIDDIV